MIHEIHTRESVLVIDLYPRWADCWLCGEPTPSRWGLPVWEGELVSNDWEGDWAGKPACERCYLLHEAGMLPTLDGGVNRDA